MKLPGRLGGRTKPRKKRKSRKKTKGLQVTTLTWFLLGAIVLLVGGIGLLKWADTGTGQATLLSLGSDRAFQDVQNSVEEVLLGQFSGMQPGVAALVENGYDWPAPELAATAAVRCRLVSVDGMQPYDQIQLELSRKLRKIGARILWAQRIYPENPAADQRQPNESKDLLRLDIGVKGKPTHTLVLHRADKNPPVIWDDQEGASAWDQLLNDSDGPLIALVIDDWGNSRNEATKGLLKIQAPMTMAILPNLPYSRQFYLQETDLILPRVAVSGKHSRVSEGRAQRLDAGCFVELRLGKKTAPIKRRRRETILHLPMQPQSYPETNPGKNPLLVGMSASEISDILDGALKNLPDVRGLNNHMGSAATSDPATMSALMSVLKQRGLFFIDSLTSSKSVAYGEAQAAGLPALRNRIFLDYDSENEKTITANLGVLVRTARKKGFAVGLGHPHNATWRVLAREIPRLQQQGVRFVTVSELLAILKAKEAGMNP